MFVLVFFFFPSPSQRRKETSESGKSFFIGLDRGLKFQEEWRDDTLDG